MRENIKLLDPSTRELTPLVELTVKDIFRRLDKIEISNIVEYEQYLEFFDRIGEHATMDGFNRALRDYCNNGDGGLNKRGFLDLFKYLA